MQAALADLANTKFGWEGERRAVFKCEGGVRIRDRDIVITERVAQDDFRRDASPTEEE